MCVRHWTDSWKWVQWYTVPTRECRPLQTWATYTVHSNNRKSFVCSSWESTRCCENGRLFWHRCLRIFWMVVVWRTTSSTEIRIWKPLGTISQLFRKFMQFLAKFRPFFFRFFHLPPFITTPYFLFWQKFPTPCLSVLIIPPYNYGGESTKTSFLL